MHKVFGESYSGAMSSLKRCRGKSIEARIPGTEWSEEEKTGAWRVVLTPAQVNTGPVSQMKQTRHLSVHGVAGRIAKTGTGHGADCLPLLPLVALDKLLNLSAP